MINTRIGIIGGSGVYDIEGLTNTNWIKVDSAFGEPSDELLFGELDGEKLVFLPRHGRGHKLSPSEINYRANIDALKKSGVTDLISVSAVGSLKEELSPGTFVIVDQFIDRTFARNKTFFNDGCVAHVSMAHPVCKRLGDHLMQGALKSDVRAIRNGTYLVMEGPQFSTLAESNLYRSWGCDVIGMTNMPEAKLAREAEICYATVAMVTDYDCWHPDHENVSVDQIVKVLSANAGNAKTLIKNSLLSLVSDKNSMQCGCKKSLDNAIITSIESRSESAMSRLSAVVSRVIK
jgi:5'-methylthioadenosine phosphorylase